MISYFSRRNGWADVCAQIHPYAQMALGILTSAAQVCLAVANGTDLTPSSSVDHYTSEPRPNLRLAFKNTKRL